MASRDAMVARAFGPGLECVRVYVYVYFVWWLDESRDRATRPDFRAHLPRARGAPPPAACASAPSRRLPHDGGRPAVARRDHRSVRKRRRDGGPPRLPAATGRRVGGAQWLS